MGNGSCSFCSGEVSEKHDQLECFARNCPETACTDRCHVCGKNCDDFCELILHVKGHHGEMGNACMNKVLSDIRFVRKHHGLKVPIVEPAYKRSTPQIAEATTNKWADLFDTIKTKSLVLFDDGGDYYNLAMKFQSSYRSCLRNLIKDGKESIFPDNLSYELVKFMKTRISAVQGVIRQAVVHNNVGDNKEIQYLIMDCGFNVGNNTEQLNQLDQFLKQFEPDETYDDLLKRIRCSEEYLDYDNFLNAFEVFIIATSTIYESIHKIWADGLNILKILQAPITQMKSIVKSEEPVDNDTMQKAESLVTKVSSFLSYLWKSIYFNIFLILFIILFSFFFFFSTFFSSCYFSLLFFFFSSFSPPCLCSFFPFPS
eukprot:TRINITY_DN444219_c1_g1_i1.p1 TRINITY_DN444219_c1_g1~~TRINITY_DN444219_c1_g1_i1.p1  ORF type:complete len:371 (-),score=59.05 TRINITY_DN444219_c1_g1_i1:9-1121(-)